MTLPESGEKGNNKVLTAALCTEIARGMERVTLMNHYSMHLHFLTKFPIQKPIQEKENDCEIEKKNIKP